MARPGVAGESTTAGEPPPDARITVAGPRALGSVRDSDRTLALITAVALAGATTLALWLRLTGLGGRDGTLSIDEARLALAGRGILEHGLPQLPSGWLYTRGLVPAYLTAASFTLLGQGDLAARFPAILAGTALVPVMYLLGSALAGRWGGLFAALFVAGYPPLVVWSRQAWFYAPYVLLYATALLFIVRAHQGGRAGDQVLAGGLVGLSFFAHELGVFLLVPLGAQVLARRWHCRLPARGWAAPLVALAIATGAALVLGLLVTRLRADTLAGAYGEVAEYFSPHLDGLPLQFYGRMLVDSRGLLLAAALLGIPLALMRRRYVVLILWLALLPPFLHAVTIIPDRPEERYGLTLMVVLVALAAESVQGWAAYAVRHFEIGRLSSGTLTGAILAIILVAHLDVGGALARGSLPPHEGAWLPIVRSRVGPDDLVMADLSTVAGWYLGDLDYWVRSRNYSKYAMQAGDVRRDVHTGAMLVRSLEDFRRQVAPPNGGRTLWVIASGRPYHWDRWVNDDLKRFLDSSAVLDVIPPDGSRILRLDL